jgi:hypothetical protein
MKKAHFTFETILANSTLSDENKHLLSTSFAKMSETERLMFVALVESDYSQLALAVEFLNNFPTPEELRNLDPEEYLLSVTQK